MPVSRLRKNRRVVATGGNLSQRRLSKNDQKMKMEAYNAKYTEYSDMELPVLLEKYEENNLGGIYRQALLDVIKIKQSNN